MRTTFAAAAVLLLAATAASSAADIGRAYAKAAPAATVHDWTGFYIGGHAGWGWSNWTSHANPLPQEAFEIFNETFNESNNGAVAGIHGGYNYQFQSSLVAGVEADISWTDLKQSSTHQLQTFPGDASCPTCLGTMSRDVNWLSSLRGRLGFAANNLLLYVTGGAAWGDVSYNSRIVLARSAYDNPASSRSVEFGWAAGAGLEYALAPNWIVRGEYLHYRLGDGANRTTFDAVSRLPFNTNWTETKINVARVGLSYKFGQ